MKYPALDVRGADGGIVLAIADDFSPTAVEELPDGVSIFFPTASHRDDAREAIARSQPQALLESREVDDENWARRSQENLTPITVGRITVTPPWFVDATPNLHPLSPNLQPPPSNLQIVILPSMGFGTGHHATTRLCLEALQALDVKGARVLDVGTGSGVLAIAAARLGASDVLGIDFDADAITNARENLGLNAGVHLVRFETVDVRQASLPGAAIVLANLTGAVLVQNAALLRSAVSDGGTLVVSGLQPHEREEVVGAIDGVIQWEKEDASWVAIAFNFPGTTAV